MSPLRLLVPEVVGSQWRTEGAVEAVEMEERLLMEESLAEKHHGEGGWVALDQTFLD